MVNIIIFIIIQLINVIISTIKSVATIRCSPWNAAHINAISYTIAAVITKLITQQTFLVVIIVTLITNEIGVYIGRKITDSFQKEKLWVYNCVIKCSSAEMKQLKQLFSEQDIDCDWVELKFDRRYKCQIYSYSKTHSKNINKILSSYNTWGHITAPVEWIKF